MSKETILKKLNEIDRLDNKIIEIDKKINKFVGSKKVQRLLKDYKDILSEYEWESDDSILSKKFKKYRDLCSVKDDLTKKAYIIEKRLIGSGRGDIITANSFTRAILNTLREIIE
jgi:archaellum component FlaC